jgi:hypothetical protein
VTCALAEPSLLRRSGLVAVMVGSALTVINHGDALSGAAAWPPGLLWKVPLTYLVPFCVATWGALANSREPRR